MAAKFGPGGNSEAFASAGFSSTLDAPAWLSKIGLDAYEYEAGNGLSAGPSTLAAIGRRAKENGIKTSYHTPYFISLSGVVEEKRLRSIDYIRQSLEAARLLGADTIVVHCGSCAKISRDEAMRLAADTLVKTVDHADVAPVAFFEEIGKTRAVCGFLGDDANGLDAYVDGVVLIQNLKIHRKILSKK